MAYPKDISIAEAIRHYGLPTSHRVHWSRARKADVVQAVHDRAITFAEARKRYLLSRDEFEQWERETGLPSLAAREVQQLEEA